VPLKAKPLPSLEYLNSVLEFRDGLLYNKITRNSRAVKGELAGCVSGKYRLITLLGQSFLVHRVAYYMAHGNCPEYLDHINGNRFDNRIENLRPATVAENSRNQPLLSSNTSGVKGLSWSKEMQKWYACIRYNKVNKNLGYFESKELGAEFLELARDMLHGSFANHGKFKENISCQLS
jgi:HNH endonuclease